MGLEDIARPDTALESVTEIWGHVLFWSCLLTTLLYLLVGVACGVCLRVAKKAVNFALPIVYLGYAALKIVSTDAIASAFVAGIYSLSGFTMTTGAALGWGVGISLASTLVNILVSCAPFYSCL